MTLAQIRYISLQAKDGGDLISDVVPVKIAPGRALPTLKLTHAVPDNADPWMLPPNVPQEVRDALPEAQKHAADASMVSPSLSAFWGRAVSIRARVLTPPGYDHGDVTLALGELLRRHVREHQLGHRA